MDMPTKMLILFFIGFMFMVIGEGSNEKKKKEIVFEKYKKCNGFLDYDDFKKLTMQNSLILVNDQCNKDKQ